uniref:hypothetical protein n=1 Tax=Agathobacter sp. TaxID=2021311 RepID=UPI004057A152
MVRLALCIPTYCRSQCVEEFLEKCAWYYLEAGIDICYFDSSPDEKTKGIVNKYIQKEERYDRVFYYSIPAEMHPNRKVYEIFKGNGFKKEYDFLWVCSDSIQFLPSAIKKIVPLIDLKYDMIVVDPRDEEGLGTRIYNEYSELLRDCAWGLTLYGASILNVHTMLKDITWEQYEKQFLKKGIINFSHVSLYFYRLVEMEQFQVLHVSLQNRQYRSSVYKKLSGWYSDTFFIMCESWVKTIEGLPEWYKSKKEAILKGGKYSVFRTKQDFYKLRLDGIFHLRVFLRYFWSWNKVCEIPKIDLLKIALTSKGYLKRMYNSYFEKEYGEFQKFSNRFTELMIYGAGRVGYVYVKFLEMQGVSCGGFLVSVKDESQYLRYPVYEIKDKNMEFKRIGIVIALQSQNAEEVCRNLEDMGLKENIFYSEYFYELICYKMGYR